MVYVNVAQTNFVCRWRRAGVLHKRALINQFEKQLIRRILLLFDTVSHKINMHKKKLNASNVVFSYICGFYASIYKRYRNALRLKISVFLVSVWQKSI